MSVDKGLANAKKLGGDFKKFIMKGNVVDLAVAVVIGGAFGKIVASLVNDLLMPVIVLITGENSLSALSVTLREAVGMANPCCGNTEITSRPSLIFSSSRSVFSCL